MKKILLVDDDTDVVETCRMVLEGAGYQVFAAHNPEDGRRVFDQERPDVLVLDVMMEQQDDGIRMAQQLRHDGKTTPILMLTSLAKVTGMGYERDSEMVPVDAFQEKPVSAERLLELVKQLVEKKG